MFNYSVRRWNGEKEIENQSFKSPVPLDWLLYFYRFENDWTDIIIEEYDKDGQNIGMQTVSKKRKEEL